MNPTFMVVLTLTGFLAVCLAEHSSTILTPTYTDEGRAQKRSAEFNPTTISPKHKRSLQSHEHGYYLHKRDIQSTSGMERQERSAPTTNQPMKREVPNSSEHPIPHKREVPNSTEHPAPHKRQAPAEVPSRARRQVSTPPSLV